MYKGPAGIDKLNEVLQELFNPASEQRRELKHGDITYRVGDKVLQLVNQPDSNVFNGDMGEIVSVFFAKENTEKQDMLVISYEGNEVTYTKQDFNQITHAYCCSIHKSQEVNFPLLCFQLSKAITECCDAIYFIPPLREVNSFNFMRRRRSVSAWSQPE